jgi:hypothetical protein
MNAIVRNGLLNTLRYRTRSYKIGKVKTLNLNNMIKSQEIFSLIYINYTYVINCVYKALILFFKS